MTCTKGDRRLSRVITLSFIDGWLTSLFDARYIRDGAGLDITWIQYVTVLVISNRVFAKQAYPCIVVHTNVYISHHINCFHVISRMK